MPRKIRVTSETYNRSHDFTEEYMDLPKEWDGWTKDERREFLNDVALEALCERAGSGAAVVDENGNEIEE